MGKCKHCRHWNDYAHTYIKRFTVAYDSRHREELSFSFDCCSYFHEAYCWDDNYGERDKDCCQPQLSFNF